MRSRSGRSLAERGQLKAAVTAYLDSIGFWAKQTLAAHGVWLPANDIRILAMRHVGVSHNPESNMKLASGTAPVQQGQQLPAQSPQLHPARESAKHPQAA